MKKILSILMAIAIVFPFAACSKTADTKASKTDDGSFVLRNEESVELGTPEKILNTQDMYEKIEYTPEMLYGRYSLRNWFENSGYDSEEMNQFKSDMIYMDDPYSDDDTKISVLPFFTVAGIETFDYGLKYETKYNWISLTFLTDNGSTKDYQFAYDIDGNHLKLTGVHWSYDNDTKKLQYEIDESIKLEYEFAFCGRTLTLSNGDKNVNLYTGTTYNGIDDYLCSDMYIASSDAIDIIEKISFRWDINDGSRVTFVCEDETGTEYIQNGIAQLSEDGLFTFTVPYKTGTKTYQFVYFLCTDDGIILTDGENTYYYTDTYWTYTKNDVEKNVDIEQIETLNNMSEDELKNLEKKKTDLFSDLANAFNDTGISVQVNKETGEIAMDSTVLFGGDSAELTNDGKEFLNKFVKAYTSIIYNEKYDGFISKTMVEGHIAPVSGTTYEGGLPLSEKRAENVKNYCLSDSISVDTTKLASTMETIGYSQSKPVYDSDGNVDFDASRRVSFRFIINLDK